MTLETVRGDNALDEDVLPHPGRSLSEQEFAAWCGPKTRAEWVDGNIIIMPPVSFEHADLTGWLLAVLRFYVESRGLGIVLGPEFFIRLPRQRRRRLPDVMFIKSDRTHLLQKQYLNGAANLIMEVVSPDSESRDWRDKYLEYERARVKEYWVIDPMSRHVELYTLRKSGFAAVSEIDQKLESVAIPGFWLKPGWLWRQPLPPIPKVMRELAPP